MAKNANRQKALDLEPGVNGLQLLLHRKRQQGGSLSVVEQHLLSNVKGLRSNLFAPSMSRSLFQAIVPLLIPLLLVGAIVAGGLRGYSYLSMDSQTLAKLKEDREINHAIELAQQGLALDSEFSFHNSTLRQAQERGGDSYKTSLVQFFEEIIATYQPGMSDPHVLAGEIVEASEREDIDPFFVAAIIASESSFRPRAQSSVGAFGLMQLMPRTAREVSRRSGKRTSPQLSHRLTNIELGIEYIKTLEKQFGGNRHFALAAYNWGPANVKKANMKQSSIPRSVEGYSRKILEKTLRWQRRFKTEKIDIDQSEARLDADIIAGRMLENG